MEKYPPGQPPPPAYDAQYQPQPYPPQPQYQPPQQQYPPQPQYQQQQQQQYPSPQPVAQQPQVVLVTTPVKFHREPVITICPHCRANITTTTHEKIGVAPWLICGGIILLGFWLGCCLIPFCIKDLKDIEHRCPSCNHVVGMYKLI